MRNHLMLFALAGVVAVFATACIFSSDDEMAKGKGTVVYLDLEGGFYGIVADNGKRYDPINLPKEFQQDGLRVSFEAKIRDDLASFHMWGQLVEIIKINRL